MGFFHHCPSPLYHQGSSFLFSKPWVWDPPAAGLLCAASAAEKQKQLLQLLPPQGRRLSPKLRPSAVDIVRVALGFFYSICFQFWTVTAAETGQVSSPSPLPPAQPQLLPLRTALTFVSGTSPSEASLCPSHREPSPQVPHGGTLELCVF